MPPEQLGDYRQRVSRIGKHYDPYLQDAHTLFAAMEGLGTDEDAIEEVISRHAATYGLKRLEDAFNGLAEVSARAEKYGGLVEWLIDDGMQEAAQQVRDAHRDRDYDKLSRQSKSARKYGDFGPP
jgi:hypothetical protein